MIKITQTTNGLQIHTDATTRLDAENFVEFTHGVTLERPVSINAPYRITNHNDASLNGWYDLIEIDGFFVFVQDVG